MSLRSNFITALLFYLKNNLLLRNYIHIYIYSIYILTFYKDLTPFTKQSGFELAGRNSQFAH